MTYTEALPTLRTLSRKDKIRAIQFLANEVALEEVYFENGRTYEIYTPYDSFEAADQLRHLLNENERANG